MNINTTFFAWNLKNEMSTLNVYVQKEKKNISSKLSVRSLTDAHLCFFLLLFLSPYLRQKKGGKGTELPKVRNFADSRISDLDKALEVDLNL